MKRDRQLVLLLLEKYEAMEPSTYEEVPTLKDIVPTRLGSTFGFVIRLTFCLRPGRRA